jgi:predicted RNA-binding protein with RPS1 domain
VRVSEIDAQGRINLSMILDEKEDRQSEHKDFAGKKFPRRSDRPFQRRPSRFPRR